MSIRRSPTTVERSRAQRPPSVLRKKLTIAAAVLVVNGRAIGCGRDVDAYRGRDHTSGQRTDRHEREVSRPRHRREARARDQARVPSRVLIEGYQLVAG